MNKKDVLSTTTEMTWCPGCFNYQVLAGVKNHFQSLINSKMKKENLALVSGIGCQGKIFDYINVNGINTLHGRELPTALGIKIGNPNLQVYAFGGDGGTYSEGIDHLIHAARENIDITFVVNNNQVFALTVGQPTAVSEVGFSDKTMPEGVFIKPLNPIKLMLNSNASFVARVGADAKQIKEILDKAQRHKGFKFIEIIQPCLIFHPDKDYKNKFYTINENRNLADFNEAMKLASEWDYDGVNEKTKIPLGIFYENNRLTFEESHWQLLNLQKKKKSWKDVKR